MYFCGQGKSNFANKGLQAKSNRSGLTDKTDLHACS